MASQKRAVKYGKAPGTYTYIGSRHPVSPNITHLTIKPAGVVSASYPIDEFKASDHKDAVSLVTVYGLNAASDIGALGEKLGIHKLVIEDILNTEKRPSLEIEKENLVVVLKAPGIEKAATLAFEHICIHLKGNEVVIFQDTDQDIIEPVRARVLDNPSRFCELGSDYLVYALCDLVVDTYIAVLEDYSDRVSELEDSIVGHGVSSKAKSIQEIRRNVSLLRKSVWPVREIVSKLLRPELALVSDSTRPYLRDLQDHTDHVLEGLDHLKDWLTQILDTYNTNLGHRMNDVMKVLTVIATIFIPITFLAGVYGMNFQFIPELSWPYSYPVFWGLAISISIIMLSLFKRKGML